VSRRVDDVDAEFGAAARVGPADRGVLRQDRDATLALQVVGIHDALAQVLALVQRVGLAQQLVDQRGLAVVDVGDDGDVAEVLEAHTGYRWGSRIVRERR
jgi:hypothetical protein